ncbi:hypothetical protein PALI_a0475 [Pseudoalteromonas aliena SW19]|uniref:Uncharacterized protein n=1 Tax=Pseudoalteromonas aliena SW19 TaxID=1314866 RepID=A0ABR9DY18_9GAMM|nr:hypothetical protein [Pseudoalteromonas aliena SW19]
MRLTQGNYSNYMYFLHTKMNKRFNLGCDLNQVNNSLY